jgi:oxaloacetate decarboxylase alpha subunit
MFPKIAPDFFKNRPNGPVVFKPEADAPPAAAPSAPAASAASTPAGQAARYAVNVDGVNYNVVVAPAGTVAITNAPVANASGAAPAIPAAQAAAGTVPVPAPVAGTVIRHVAKEGAAVKAGETVLIMESMKMELEIKATASGNIHFIVPTGATVAAQQPIAELHGVAGAAPVAPPPSAPAPQAGVAQQAAAPQASSGATVMPAPVAGTVIRHVAKEGGAVKSGDTVLIMESMKMELEIKATASGAIHFLVPTGATVAAQQPIAEIH